ncbi:MAG TPA: glycine/betaine/sarcosine/D-proline family reductase selenoprotein B, partial [Candidatus Binatia bacterium]
MAEKIRVVHYLNQFFAQIGGEEKADIGPGFKEGPTGPGRALQQALAEHGEVIATLFCGDNYFAEHAVEATEELLRQMARCKAHLLIAGPAFESGRYGVACARFARRLRSDSEFMPWPA